MQRIFRSFILLLTLMTAVHQAQSFFDAQKVSRAFTSCMKSFTTAVCKKQAVGPLLIIGGALIPVLYSWFKHYKANKKQNAAQATSTTSTDNENNSENRNNEKISAQTKTEKTIGNIKILQSIGQTDGSSCGYFALFNSAQVYRDLQKGNNPEKITYSDTTHTDSYFKTFYPKHSDFVKSILRKQSDDEKVGWLRGDELEACARKEFTLQGQNDCLVIDNVSQWLSAEKNYQGFLDEHVQKLQNWYSSPNVTKVFLISDSEEKTYGVYQNHWIVCIAHKDEGNVTFYVLDSINGATTQTRIVQQLCSFLSTKETFLNAKLAILISDPLDTINRLMPKAQHDQPVEEYNGTQEKALRTVLDKLELLTSGVEDADVCNSKPYKSLQVSIKGVCTTFLDLFRNNLILPKEVRIFGLSTCTSILNTISTNNNNNEQVENE